MRRKQSLLLIFFICHFLFSNEYLYSQCGVTPGISCVPDGFMLRTNINAGPTVFDPGWAAYDWKWRVNNSIISSDSILNPIGLPDGFSNVCLTVSATNSSTGDSCTKEICNIFQSTGFNIFAYLDVYAIGLDVSVNVFILTGDTTGFPFEIDWGDGTTSATGPFDHTYAAPGDYYLTCLNTFRKVQVDNGNPNMDISNFGGIAPSGCYPVNTPGIYSIPPFVVGSVYMFGHATFTPPINIYDGVPIVFPSQPEYPVVPGQAIITANIEDINYNQQFIFAEKHTPVYFDVCGVVPDTITGKVFHDLDADGLLDAGEPGLPNIEVFLRSLMSSTGMGNYHVLTDSTGNYSILAPNAGFRIKTGEPSVSVTFPQANTYQIDGAANDTFPQYNFGIADLNTVISGYTYLDYDQDSTYNNNQGDVPFQSVTVKAENSINGLKYYANSGSNGFYSFNIPMGNYSITPTESNNLDSAVNYPDTIFVNSSGGFFTQQNFGFYSPVSGNFNIRIYGPNEARPGFDYSNNIRIENTGFDTMSGTVIFSFDTILTVTSIFPISGIIDNVNHTVSWSTGLILPTFKNTFFTSYTIPPGTPLGTIMNFNGQVNPDSGYTDNYLGNNTDTCQQTVIGSYDPNDKKVDPPGMGAQGNVLHSERLHYRINFQNTGTASAINVIVQDEMDSGLDLNTFQMEDASHTYNLVTNGNTFTWKFFSINLPDSNTNEPASHGFIEYSIKPIQGLPDWTEIENTAAIYFDFNSPVITNTTLNTLQTVLSSVEEISGNTHLYLFPVPVQNEITIMSETGLNEDISIELLDITGKLIRKVYRGKGGDYHITANISDLASGTYIIRVLSDSDVMRKLFVKQ